MQDPTEKQPVWALVTLLYTTHELKLHVPWRVNDQLPVQSQTSSTSFYMVWLLRSKHTKRVMWYLICWSMLYPLWHEVSALLVLHCVNTKGLPTRLDIDYNIHDVSSMLQMCTFLPFLVCFGIGVDNHIRYSVVTPYLHDFFTARPFSSICHGNI